MKRKGLVILGVATLLLCSASGFAAQITLQNSAANAITFTGGGGGFTVTFNAGAFGKATDDLGGPSGVYAIQQEGTTVSATPVGGGVYNLTQSGGINNGLLSFTYGGVKGSGSLLFGNLQLVDIQQTGSTGNFNNNLVVNLFILGGKLATQFVTNNGILQLTIHFPSGANLASILNGGGFNAVISDGTVVPVPEPASLVMLGSTLLAFGGLGWKAKLFVR